MANTEKSKLKTLLLYDYFLKNINAYDENSSVSLPDIQNYLLKLEAKKKRGVITFSTKYGSDEYQFYITVDNTGSATIRVTPEDRDYIEYEGNVHGL